jgi:hypothetical protein
VTVLSLSSDRNAVRASFRRRPPPPTTQRAVGIAADSRRASLIRRKSQGPRSLPSAILTLVLVPSIVAQFALKLYTLTQLIREDSAGFLSCVSGGGSSISK